MKLSQKSEAGLTPEQIPEYQWLDGSMNYFDYMVKTPRFAMLMSLSLLSYEMPMTKRENFIEERRKRPKKIIKTLSDDQAEKLRSLGYVD